MLVALLVFLLLAGFAEAVRAQSLADALARAWARDPEAASLAAREAEARAAAELAASWTPGSAEAAVSMLSDRLDRHEGRQKWDVELGVPLWLPGQRAATRDQAQVALERLDALRASLRLALAGELRSRWWALAEANEAHELALRRVATARELEAGVLRRFESGDLARIDANLARSERLAAEAQELEARSTLDQARQALRAMTGIEPPAQLEPEQAAADAAHLEEHPLLRRVRADARFAGTVLEVAVRSDREAPTIAVLVERERGSAAEPFSNSVGLRLSIPFSSGARSRQRSAAAAAELARAEAAVAATRLRLESARQQARVELETAHRQLELAGRGLGLASDNLQLAERSFALGEGGLATLLRIRASELDARRLLAQRRIALEAARSQWNQALGVMP